MRPRKPLPESQRPPRFHSAPPSAHRDDDLLIPANWQPKPKLLRPTGITFLDQLLDGGAGGGEVHCLLDSDGSCAATVANMILVEAARQEQDRTQKPNSGGRTRLAVYLCWRGSHVNNFRRRALAYAARIRLDRLQRTRDSLSPSEREGARTWLSILDKHTAYSELGAMGRSPSCLQGAVNEVCRIVEAALKTHAADEVSTLIIDCAVPIIDSYLTEEITFRHQLSKFISELKTKVGRRFNCDLWLLHRLRNRANSRNAEGGALKTVGAEYKAIRHALDFCFTFGNPLPNGQCVLSCARHQRYGDRGPRMVRLQNDFCRVLATKAGHKIDRHLG